MTNKQLRDEAMTLIFAGHETTAHNLTWAWYLLASNQDKVARAREEIDRTVGDRPVECCLHRNLLGSRGGSSLLHLFCGLRAALTARKGRKDLQDTPTGPWRRGNGATRKMMATGKVVAIRAGIPTCGRP